jgi:hypothetical protein
MIGRPIDAGAPADQGEIMTLAARIMHMTTGALLGGLIMWAYVGICVAYAVDCF